MTRNYWKVFVKFIIEEHESSNVTHVVDLILQRFPSEKHIYNGFFSDLAGMQEEIKETMQNVVLSKSKCRKLERLGMQLATRIKGKESDNDLLNIFNDSSCVTSHMIGNYFKGGEL